MKRFTIITLLLLVTIFSCTKKEPSIVPQKDTPLYELAQKTAEKLPYLNPDENNILVSTKYFDIRTGDLFSYLKTNYGNRVNQIPNLEAERIKDIITRNAQAQAERKMLYREAQKEQIEISEADIDTLLQAQYQRAGSQEKFLSWLEQNGIDLNSIKADMRKGLTINRYLDQILSEEIQVSEEEIMAEYNQDKTATVRHILLKTQGMNDSAKQETYQKAEDILAKAKAGEDFAELAKKYSEDPGSKESGGLYNDFGRGQMVQSFEDASFNTPIGELSDIVETTYGYHIIKVEDRKKEERPLEEVHDDIQNRLQSEKQQEVYTNFLDKLKTQYKFQLKEF